MQEGEPRFDFPAVSDEAVEVPMSFAETEPGVSILRDEKVYDAAGPKYEKGARSGVVHIEQRRPSELGEDSVVVRVVIRFFDNRHSTITASGALPFHSSETAGSGRLAIVGGTGKFHGVHGELVVESENPKRWSIEGGG